MLVAGCTNYSIYFFNLCHDFVFIAFCHASGDNQCLTSAAVFHFSHFKDGLDTLLLGVMDEAACIDNNDVCFYFIVHQCKAVRPKNAKHDFGIHKVFITAQGNKKDCQVIGICITHKYYLSVFWRRTASTQLYISMAMVIGPTPPGTGVIALTKSMTSSRSTSPQSLFCSFR